MAKPTLAAADTTIFVFRGVRFRAPLFRQRHCRCHPKLEHRIRAGELFFFCIQDDCQWQESAQPRRDKESQTACICDTFLEHATADRFYTQQKHNFSTRMTGTSPNGPRTITAAAAAAKGDIVQGHSKLNLSLIDSPQ